MENHTNNEEKVLITNLKNGSHKAFDSIYQMYSKRLYAYSYQYTKSVEDAKDIVQEVFINLWKSRTTIRQNDTLQPLLFVMAKYKLINAYRSKINNEEYKEYQELMRIIAVEDTIQQVEYNDSMQRVMEILSKLPVTQQRVIQLSRFKKLTNKVIAETLSLSEQTVKNQLSIGLKTLRKKLLYVVLSIMFM